MPADSRSRSYQLPGQCDLHGITILVLAGLALLSLRRAPKNRRLILGYVALALGAWLVALGPEVRLFGHSLLPGPFAWLREFEVFRMIRVPARASVFLALGVSMLAGFGLDRIRRTGWRVLLAALALLEAAAAPLNVVAADRCTDASAPVPAVYAWLAGQPGNGAVIELPILPNDGLFQRPRFDDSVYLLRSTAHWKPLVNGYAGVEPAEYARVREIMKDFPSESSIALLRSLGVEHVIVNGQLALRDGQLTGARPGRVVRGPGWRGHLQMPAVPGASALPKAAG